MKQKFYRVDALLVKALKAEKNILLPRTFITITAMKRRRQKMAYLLHNNKREVLKS